MTSDSTVVALAEQTVRARLHGEASVKSIVIIGSHAYPEFARENSDLDMLVIHDLHPGGPHSTLLQQVPSNGPQSTIIGEIRMFSTEQFEDYILCCDVAKQFAFIRGYKIVADSDGFAEAAIQICVNRFWTDSLKAYGELRGLDIKAKSLTLQYQFTDAMHYISDPRLSRRGALIFLRLSEIVKDFIVQMWVIDFARKARCQEITGLDKASPLLDEVGLLRVFNEPHGARILDSEKYRVPKVISAISSALDEALPFGPARVFACMNSLYEQSEGESLLFPSEATVLPAYWPYGG